MNRPQYEIADILREYGAAFFSKYQLPLQHLKVMSAIKSCRTSALGGHIEKCSKCSHLRISYNSCRNRHCPKCQFLKTEQWIENRKADLLPVTYFHVVFTIPDSLNGLALVNQEIVYNILFKSCWETLSELGKDNKHLGAKIGAIAVLHTWGQNLMDHPHLHCIVPQGGLTNGTWRYTRYNEFLFPVKVVSRLFKGKFMYYLRQAYKNDELKFEGTIASIKDKKDFQHLVDKLYKKDWVVYCKKPFHGPNQVIEYLGRYTHRIAISNHRIKEVKDGYVSFSYKDYKAGGRQKVMRLDAVEFIRRYLLHVLPQGFCKIRHYGLLSNRQKQLGLKTAKSIFKVKSKDKVKLSGREIIIECIGKDIAQCPECKKGMMEQMMVMEPKRGSPITIKEMPKAQI